MKRLGFVLSLLLAFGSAHARTYFLTDQWQKGPDRFCKYGNGAVLNVGVGICPSSIEG
jgi:hypothetical protein